MHEDVRYYLNAIINLDSESMYKNYISNSQRKEILF